jgi:5-carboxymethyl-2-hydroxymuconate isomerase
VPHFIVEYTANLEQELQLELLFTRAHAELIGMRLFPTGGIRSRARRIDYYRFADGARDYAGVHIQVKLSAARPADVRRQVGEALFELCRAHFAPLQAKRYLALSLEVGLFEPDLFFNHNNLHSLFAQT